MPGPPPLARAHPPWSRAALALVCVALQIASVTHYAIVSHEICPEHGEVVEGPSGHPHREAAASPTSHARAFGGATPSEPEGAHDHCAMAFERRDHALLRTEPRAVLPAFVADASRPLARAIVPRAPIPILLNAPKSSPPA